MNREACHTIEPMLSGYVDNELTAAERRRAEAHLEHCGACRKVLEEMEQLTAVTAPMRVAEPPEEVWETFLDNVYNRLERRTGWVFFLFGAMALSAFALYHYVYDPWTSPVNKALFALPISGLAVLFVSVWRQRLFVAKTDRYSRDVKR